MNTLSKMMQRKHTLINTANRYRANSTDEHIKNSGVVLLFDEKVYGWKNTLRDAHCEQPGSIAVDLDGNCYEAQAGDAYHGAKGWVYLQENGR